MALTHVLRAGVTLCGVPWTRRLGTLNPLDTWVGDDQAEIATCSRCMAAARDPGRFPPVPALPRLLADQAPPALVDAVSPERSTPTPPWLRPRPPGPAPIQASAVEAAELHAGEVAAREAEQARDVRAIDNLGPRPKGNLTCGCARCGCLCAQHSPNHFADPCPEHGDRISPR